VDLLKWSVAFSQSGSNRICECSRFGARFVPGAVLTDSYALWCDVPLLLPRLPRVKCRQDGNPALRSIIPEHLADVVALHFSAGIGFKAVSRDDGLGRLQKPVSQNGVGTGVGGLSFVRPA
jgi:hypothetical protein